MAACSLPNADVCSPSPLQQGRGPLPPPSSAPSSLPRLLLPCSRYSPYGNYAGQYATNVQPLKGVGSTSPPPPLPTVFSPPPGAISGGSPPPPPGAAPAGTGAASNPIVVPASLPWTSSQYSFSGAFSQLLGQRTCADDDGGLFAGDMGFLFSWTAPASGEVQLSTCGLTNSPSTDTQVSVLTGTASAGGGLPANPTCYKGGDQGCGAGTGATLAKFQAVQGTTYWWVSCMPHAPMVMGMAP